MMGAGSEPQESHKRLSDGSQVFCVMLFRFAHGDSVEDEEFSLKRDYRSDRG